MSADRDWTIVSVYVPYDLQQVVQLQSARLDQVGPANDGLGE